MCRFWMRNNPVGAIEVGTWISYLETCSQLGIVMRLLIIFLTSGNKLNAGVDPGYRNIVIAMIICEHFVITCKHIIIVSLPKEPSWVTDAKRLVKTRKSRASKKIENVKNNALLDKSNSEKDVVDSVLNYINTNEFLLELLVPKLHTGANNKN